MTANIGDTTDETGPCPSDAQSALAFIVEEVASSKPVPAGGAAAAAALGLGLALLAKASRIAPASRREPALTERLDIFSAAAVRLFDDDCEAFRRVIEARRSKDPGRVGAAWTRAVEVPLELAALGAEALRLAPDLARRTKRAVRPDVTAATELVTAGARISLENAAANLPRVASSVARDRLQTRLTSLRDSLGRLTSEPPSTSPDKRPANELSMSAGASSRAARRARAECLRAATEAIELAGYAGLCVEGRLDLVLDAIRNAPVDAA